MTDLVPTQIPAPKAPSPVPETGINRYQPGDHRDGPMATSDAVLGHSHILGQLSVWTHEQHLTFIFLCAFSLFSFQAGSVSPAGWEEPLTTPTLQALKQSLRDTDRQAQVMRESLLGERGPRQMRREVGTGRAQLPAAGSISPRPLLEPLNSLRL